MGLHRKGDAKVDKYRSQERQEQIERITGYLKDTKMYDFEKKEHYVTPRECDELRNTMCNCGYWW